MRASPSLSQLWQPHSRLCQLCRVCEQQRSCSPGFCRKELHATESAVEVRRARRRLREAATDERVGLFTPDKKRGTADGAGRAANLAARRGTVCGEVGRVPPCPSTQHPPPLHTTQSTLQITIHHTIHSRLLHIIHLTHITQSTISIACAGLVCECLSQPRKESVAEDA